MATQHHPPGVFEFPNHGEWLDHRIKSNRIGASDAAAALGESPWVSPLTLYDKLTSPRAPEPPTAKMRVGLISEANAIAVFDLLEGEKGSGVHSLHLSAFFGKANCSYFIIESSKYPWMSASPDSLTIEPDGSYGLLEVKCPGSNMIHEWRDEPPLEYLIQLYHQWIVLKEIVPNLTKLRLAAWFGGTDLVVYEFDEPDQDMIEWILAAESRLWDRVQRKSPPAPDGSRSSIDTLKKMAGPVQPGAEAELPEALVTRYFAARDNREAQEREEKLAASDIMQALGSAEIGTVKGRRYFTWKDVTYNYQPKDAYSDTRRVFSPARNWRKLAESELGLTLTPED